MSVAMKGSDSTKGLQIVKTFLIGFAMLLAFLGAAVPFWFQLTVKISLDGGRTMFDKVLDVGIYYMDQGGIQMIDLIHVQKASNANTIPRLLGAAQIFYMVGVIGLLVCFVASVIYLCRRFNTATGELFLAGGLLPSAGCLTLGMIFALLAGLFNTEAWESLPVPSHYMIPKAYPDVTIQWGTYVAAAASLFAIIACIFQWLHACGLCNHVYSVRYQMIRTPVREDEEGLNRPKANMGMMRSHNVGYSGARYNDRNMVEVDF